MHSIFLDPTDENEIIKIAANLKSKAAPGWDELPSSILKLVIEPISDPLAKLANISMSLGIFPEDMKLSKVKALYKAKEKYFLNNHRPISLLIALSKVFETLFHRRLYKFAVKCKLFFKHQFAFQPGLSTEHAVLLLQKRINECFESKEFGITIFLDLQKAFDTLDQAILLKKT